MYIEYIHTQTHVHTYTYVNTYMHVYTHIRNIYMYKHNAHTTYKTFILHKSCGSHKTTPTCVALRNNEGAKLTQGHSAAIQVHQSAREGTTDSVRQCSHSEPHTPQHSHMYEPLSQRKGVISEEQLVLSGFPTPAPVR